MKIQFAIFAIALSVGTAVQAAEQTYVPLTFSTLTRAQVQADLAAWRAAGLADEWRGDQTPDIYSTEYRRKLAAYQQAVAQQKAQRAAHAEGAYVAVD